MGVQYTFSHDDVMDPVYCRVCRQQVPRAVLSAAGLCPGCIQAEQVAAQQTALPQQQAQQAVHGKNTGMGRCPQCQSTNVAQIENTARDGTGKVLKAVGCPLSCIGSCFLFLPLLLPLLILGIVLFVAGCFFGNGIRLISTSRACHYCGHRWLV